MAYTLAHLAGIETDPLRQFVIINLLRNAKAMEVIPWESVDSLRSIAIRWRTLPSVAFRAIGGTYTASEGTTEQVWESVYAIGGELLFDRVFKKIKNTVVDPYRQQSEMKLEAMSLVFNDYLINGDHATEPNGFEGFKKRAAGSPARASVYYAGVSGDSTAALDVTGSAANVVSFFKKLEQQYVNTNGGKVNAIFLNEAMMLGVGHAARYIQGAGGMFLDTTKDSFDRDIVTYRGAPMIDMGLKADQSTDIITDTEVANDSGADATSIYMTSWGLESGGITGIELPPGLEVYDPNNGGEMSTQPATQVRVEWWLGLAQFGSYGITRGRNVEGASNWTA